MSKSKIHIKPENKGKFTAKAKAQGKGVQEYAQQVLANSERYSPVTVKQANFARNSASWNKEEGGQVYNKLPRNYFFLGDSSVSQNMEGGGSIEDNIGLRIGYDKQVVKRGYLPPAIRQIEGKSLEEKSLEETQAILGNQSFSLEDLYYLQYSENRKDLQRLDTINTPNPNRPIYQKRGNSYYTLDQTQYPKAIELLQSRPQMNYGGTALKRKADQGYPYSNLLGDPMYANQELNLELPDIYTAGTPWTTGEQIENPFQFPELRQQETNPTEQFPQSKTPFGIPQIDLGVKGKSASRPNSFSNMRGLEEAGEIDKGSTANAVGGIAAGINTASRAMEALAPSDSKFSRAMAKGNSFADAAKPLQSLDMIVPGLGTGLVQGARLVGAITGGVQAKNEDVEKERIENTTEFLNKYQNMNFDQMNQGNYLARYGSNIKSYQQGGDVNSLVEEIFTEFDNWLSGGGDSVKKSQGGKIYAEEGDEIYLDPNTQQPYELPQSENEVNRLLEYQQDFYAANPRQEWMKGVSNPLGYNASQDYYDNRYSSFRKDEVSKRLLKDTKQGWTKAKKAAQYESLTPEEREFISESSYAGKLEKLESFGANKRLKEIAKLPMGEQMKLIPEIEDLYSKAGRLPRIPKLINPASYIADLSPVRALMEGNYGEAAAKTAMTLAAGAMGEGVKSLLSLGGMETELAEHAGKRLVKSKPKFKSEIDWGKWNPDTPKYPELINEYNAIEESTKKAGTWMKNPDGSAFQGTPEQFIQQQSSWFKRAYPEGAETTYKGVGARGRMDVIKTIQENPYASPFFVGDKNIADIYTSKFYNKKTSPIISHNNKKFNPSANAEVHQFYFAKDPNKISIDLNGQNWTGFRLPKEAITNNKEYQQMIKELPEIVYTGTIQDYVKKKNLNYITLNNITEGGAGAASGNISIINPIRENVIKSAVGNVGFFDMTNPNIYKSLAPLIGLGTLAGSQKPEMKNGGTVTEQDILDEFDVYLSKTKLKSRYK